MKYFKQTCTFYVFNSKEDYLKVTKLLYYRNIVRTVFMYLLALSIFIFYLYVVGPYLLYLMAYNVY